MKMLSVLVLLAGMVFGVVSPQAHAYEYPAEANMNLFKYAVKAPNGTIAGSYSLVAWCYTGEANASCQVRAVQEAINAQQAIANVSAGMNGTTAYQFKASDLTNFVLKSWASATSTEKNTVSCCIYGYWVTYAAQYGTKKFVPRTDIETGISPIAAARQSAVAGASSGDSAGNNLTCPAEGCVTTVAKQPRTTVPLVDVDVVHIPKISQSAPLLPARQ